MSIARVFLGFDGPCLPRAAAWLRERYGSALGVDMSGVTVALPGARAGRRLLELLAAEGGALAPPRIITVGSLPELLYAPAKPVADALTALLARVAVLREAGVDLLSPVVPRPPAADDLLGWLALARELEKLSEELSGEQVTLEAVIAQGQKQVDFTEEPRWRALAALQRAYEETLRERGLIDRHAARAEAIESKSCRTAGEIVLIACADLPRTTRFMLHQVAAHVTSLIHAPRDEANGFDELGCVLPPAWCDRPIEVPEEIVHIADRPRDQAGEAVWLVDEMVAGRRADEITVGVGDEAMTPMLHRALDLAGHPAHAPVGRSAAQSRPATLLAALAAFLSRERLDDFATLLRHGDLDAWLHTVVPRASTAIAGWLTLLDNYINDHLLARRVGAWLGKAERAADLKKVHVAVLGLVASAVGAAPEQGPKRRATALDTGQQPLPLWSAMIASLLEKVYGQSLDPRETGDVDLMRAFEAIGEALREQAALDPDDALTPRVDLPTAIRLTLARLADVESPAAGEPSGPAIELLGWLELQLDDAPAMIITGFNEHHIPQTSAGGGADAFLPDSLRRSLGMLDSTRRFARDAAAFTGILHSRPAERLALIAGRRGHDDEPLKPSRLLLTGDADALARRILRFYPQDPAHSDTPSHPLRLAVGSNRFLIPAPTPPPKPLDAMRVTWFRTYLECPYRFYLKHVKDLCGLSDACVEMDALHFGTLAHEVLGQFGKSDLRDCDDAAQIRAFFNESLDRETLKRFGDHPPVPVALQIVQLRDRLGALAAWQAKQPREGWRILSEHIEVPVQTTFDIDGAMVTVHGRIDRIDRHESGVHRVLDYKTGDSGEGPEKVHRRGTKDKKDWIDLQLPLYHRLAAELGISGTIELGYVLLPKKLEDAGYEPAAWSEVEIQSAMVKAEDVMRMIRAGRFWPPRDVGAYEDEFSAICLEGFDGRDAILRQITKELGLQ